MHEIDCKLKFETPVVLVGGAPADVTKLQSLIDNSWPVVAADGGANTLREWGITPAAIIGDLDSLQDIEYWNKQTRVIPITEQDSTDFEKCLYTVQAPLLVAIGFTGKRFDHTLVTLHLMQKYLDKKLLLITADDVCFAWRGELRLQLPIGARFSVYPLKSTHFIGSKGLKYPLDDLILEQGQMIGTSNIVSLAEVGLQARPEGIYSVIVSLDYFNTISAQLSVVSD